MKQRTSWNMTRLLTFAVLAGLATSLAAFSASRAAAEDGAYVVEISDVTAKVGEPAVLHAILHIRDGYRVLQSYNNRAIELSSFDDGVAFDQRVVKATPQDGGLEFAISLKATKPGKHPINGYFRVGYVGTGEFAMVSLPLIANVNGTE
jgi:hypothetical protein